MATTPNRRVGRRSKGERKVVAFRLPTDKADMVNELAAKEGYKYVSDWLAQVVEDRIDKTDLSAIRNQGELPIGRIA
ncbi:hypothetical protein [Arthrobacter sp. A2-55]|uniref:hypothetical protein n=1 Tax=Arthrobacter sp. A2-55 TaxID=2897337 RepID=UPI0021CD8C02|nr:hypothetical protein [Arthrobacter sp. A2-55]MCU6480550.1 hypothetical protein [Arthrobacter sp. A2-55]